MCENSSLIFEQEFRVQKSFFSGVTDPQGHPRKILLPYLTGYEMGLQMCDIFQLAGDGDWNSKLSKLWSFSKS